MTTPHVHRSVEPVPRDPRDLHLGRHCACGATICGEMFPTRRVGAEGDLGSMYGCVLTKGHGGLHDNPILKASQLYWPRSAEEVSR